MNLARLALVLAAAAACAAPLGAKELKPWKGGAPPPLELKDLQGRDHRLEDYRGSVVVVNFWATWCEPCRDEMPAMQRLKERMAGAPFALLAVNYAEGNPRVESFLKQVPVDFAILMDRDSAVSKRWQARVLPYTVVLDPGLRIRYTVTGELDWSAPEVEAALRKLLPPR
ncbi:MAG TPA: TlpA disulfide reductase family protein [Burkholderiales bacterium]|nr:TlpA disulfide reductase family protein [Burkholderiales bacterium]